MSSAHIVKLQVPISNTLRTKAQKAARKNGYSSVQEVIRVFLQMFSSGRVQPSFRIQNETFSEHQVEQWSQMADTLEQDMKKKKVQTAQSADELCKQLAA